MIRPIDHRPRLGRIYTQHEFAGCEDCSGATMAEYLFPSPPQEKPWFGWSRGAIGAIRDTKEMRKKFRDPGERTVAAMNAGLLTETQWPSTLANGNNLPPPEVMEQSIKNLFDVARLAPHPERVRLSPLLMRFYTCDEYRNVGPDGMVAPTITNKRTTPHQVVLAGQRKEDGRFIIFDSQGPGFGDKGCTYVERKQLMELLIQLYLVTLRK